MEQHLCGKRADRLVPLRRTEAEAVAIRAAYQQQGELSAAVELRRLFPGITDNAEALECARTIAGWKPLALRTVPRAACLSGED
jgi:hypothetical protein